jgi:TonB-linked SusC/RagA family outer membrane protein
MEQRRFLCIVMLLTALFLPLSLNAQRYTLNFDRESLASAFRKVEKNTSYKISYVYKDVEKYQVTAEIANQTIDQVMQTLLHQKPLQYSIHGKMIDVWRAAQKDSPAKDRRVTGKVHDQDNEPLIGANVTLISDGRPVAGSMAVTDINGNFSFDDAGQAQEVEVTYIGFQKKRMRIGPYTNLDITIFPEENSLAEVVVTGYQTISKERATGSFAKVTTKELESKRFSNLSQMLEGEIAGFNTSSGFIRGVTSMNGVSQPLYVIDGFPVENTRYTSTGSLQDAVPDLNVEDIESVTVLKDAAAASIYGARAANGVVVIVTKKAKHNATTVSVNSSLTFHPYSFPKDHFTDAADMIQIEREWANTNPNLKGDGVKTYAQSLLDNNAYPSQGIRAILRRYAGQISEAEMESRLADLASQGYRYYDNVAKYAKRTALYQQYNVSVGNGSKNNNFRLSFTYRNNKMNDRYTNDNSFGIDLRDVLNVTKWLTFEFGNYTYYKKGKQQSFDAMSPTYNYMPYDRLVNDDGTPYTYTQTDRLSKSTQDIISSNGLYSLDITPIDEMSRNISHQSYFTNRTYGKLNFEFTPWLKYNVMFQYEYGSDRTRMLYEKDSYYVRNLVDQYATADNGTTTFNVPYGNIFDRTYQTAKSYTFRQQLNFDDTFGGKHNVTALLGHEVRKNTVDYSSITLYNYDPDILSYTLMDQNVLSNTYGLLGGYGLQPYDFAQDRFIDNRYVSVYANAAYTYDDRYMVSASIRWDRSNLWGTSSKYQKKPIWSLGAGWNIDREAWFHADWIDRLKLRLSHGIAGNVAKDAAPYMTANVFNNTHVGGIYESIATRPNPSLRWEKTTTTNIGLDFSLLHHRIDGSVEYYDKHGIDLLANTMGVPTEGFGYTTYQINNGRMRNRGVELSLSGSIVEKENYGLRASMTYSHNYNKVEYVNVEAPVYYLQLDYPDAYPIVGDPYNAIYAYHWAGLSSEGLPQVYDIDGKAVTQKPGNLAAIFYAGSSEPTDMASLTLNARYKHLDFSCLWVFQGGHKMRNSSIPLLQTSYNGALNGYVTTLGATNKDITSRWQQAGDEMRTNIPRNVFAEDPAFSSDFRDMYYYSDINVISATHLRLANLSLAYRLPQQWVSKVYMKSARVQLNVENVCTFAKSKNAKYMLGGYEAPSYVLGLYIDL